MVSLPPKPKPKGAKSLVIGTPVDDFDQPPVESMRIECEECGRVMWVARAAMEGAREHPPYKAVCISCSAREDMGTCLCVMVLPSQVFGRMMEFLAKEMG